MSTKKQKPIEKTLIIDVGTANVSAGIVTIGKHHTPLLDSVERVPLSGGTESAREALLVHTEEALKTLLEKFNKEHPKHVRVVLAAPWYEARIRTITSSSEKPTPISERTILKAVEQYKSEAPPKSGNEDVEALAVQTRVNGYNTFLTKPVIGQNIAINFYESEADSDTQKKITNLVEKAFPHAARSYHTFPLIAAVALRALTNQTSFAMVDVAGEMTEIAIMHEDCMSYLSSFPVGYHTLARGVAEKKDQVADALSRLALYGRNELSESEHALVESRFNKAFSVWVEFFEKVFRDASETIPIPQQLFLITDKEQVLWIRKGLQEHNTFAMNIETVGSPFVQNMLEIGDAGTYDIFLSLSALFFHTYKEALIGE